MFLKDLVDTWKKEQAKKKAERVRVDKLFNDFLEETKQTVPSASKHPQAALYRHAWKRAVALSLLFKDIPSSERHELYEEFANIAANKYQKVAPSNAYGAVRLNISPEALLKLCDKELNNLFPSESKLYKSGELACIYIGMDDSKKYYIGQTTNTPEFRWAQHRAHRTGPFKHGADYITWNILERNVVLSELDKKEAYYIGFYNSYENGYNDTRGNDHQSYQRGISDSEKS